MEVKTLTWREEQELMDELLEAMRQGEGDPHADCAACGSPRAVPVILVDKEGTVAQCIKCATKYVTREEPRL